MEIGQNNMRSNKRGGKSAYVHMNCVRMCERVCVATGPERICVNWVLRLSSKMR